MKISTQKTKVMAFHGKYPIRTKICIENKIIQQVSHSKYLGCDVRYDMDDDINQKCLKFQTICGAIRRTLKGKASRDT